LCGPSEKWDRVDGTNSFKKREGDSVLHYKDPGACCMCFGLGCTTKLAKCNMEKKRDAGFGKILASEIEGCWGCATSRCTCWAVEYKTAEGEDTLIHQGCCFPLLLPYKEPWDREGQSNVFVKRGKGDKLEYHSPGGPMFGKEFVTCRLCRC